MRYSAAVATERLQKILARAGFASRRGAEELIAAGKVKVNGKRVSELGVKADARKDRIEVEGKLVTSEPLVYVLFHKPRGVVCTMSDPEGRPTVAQYVADVRARVVPVGRLDFHTSGVLLLTNDGEFSAALAHPSRKVEKVYVAKVRGVVDNPTIEKMRQPIEIDGKLTQPAEVKRLRVEGDKTWIQVILREGRNRQVHRMTEAVDSVVFRLARLSFAGLTAEGLRPGQWRFLTKDELREFKATFGYPKRIAAPPAAPLSEQVDRTRRRLEKRVAHARKLGASGESAAEEASTEAAVRRNPRSTSKAPRKQAAGKPVRQSETRGEAARAPRRRTKGR